MKRAEQLSRAYRASCYFAGAHAVRIGQDAPASDALLRRWRVPEGVFIAAGNPRSRRMPAGWNARRHAALRERLRALPHVEGKGGVNVGGKRIASSASVRRAASALRGYFGKTRWSRCGAGRRRG
jgi:hypothetical protein